MTPDYRVLIAKSLTKATPRQTPREKSIKCGVETIRKASEMGPFEKWIRDVLLDTNLKLPQFILYNGRTKPQEHICRYKSAMVLVSSDEAILCKAFPSTLTEKALTQFTSLKANYIDSLYTLENCLENFSTAGELPKTREDLTNVKQSDDEPLLEYWERFKRIYDKIEGHSQDTVITCFEEGLRSHALKTEFGLRHPGQSEKCSRQ